MLDEGGVYSPSWSIGVMYDLVRRCKESNDNSRFF